tara:strand:- start:162 stop:695 length:534 start_codon:yes stop_codon:yes gene_type:complete
MKKIITNFTIVALSIVSFSSCIATNKGVQSSPVISRNVQLDPIKADINVDETKKIKGESSSGYFLCFRVSGDNSFTDGINYSTDALSSLAHKANPLNLVQARRLNKVRSSAAFKALNNGDYDVLVHPNYLTTVENYLFFHTYKVTVEGYGAKYENFRTERQKIVIFQDGKELILQDK